MRCMLLFLLYVEDNAIKAVMRCMLLFLLCVEDNE